jgi:predicted transcriptional regulator
MTAVLLDVQPVADSLNDFTRVWRSSRPEPWARISFATPELLWKVLTAKRWEILKAMAGQGAMSLREVARRVSRDVKSVHGDVHALLDAGVLRRTDPGETEFPYDSVHVEFTLHAA